VETTFFWIGFHLLIAILLVADLGFVHRQPHAVKFKEACILSGCWIAVALLFNLMVGYFLGSEKALQFFTGYLIEKSLSVDNLFIFLLLFLHFRIPPAFQHKILYWGIIGALIFRIGLILAGVVLITKYHWMFYVFGAFLFVSGIKFLFQKERDDRLSDSLLLRFFRKVLPVAKEEGQKNFFVKEKKRWKVTNLFLALLMLESIDILFALDSIPAIFAITTDPFIVYTSNVFAILGLRSLYFVLAASLEKLHYLKFGLAAILIFIGIKMLVGNFITISVFASLMVIIAILGLTVLASIAHGKEER
jgi:tellurite resistance protein TerC